MVKVAPPAPRARVSEDGAALSIVVPARRDWFLLFFLTLGVAACLIVVGDSLLHARKWFQIANQWLPTLYGLWLTYLWLWNVSGREEITVNSDGFSVRYAAFGMGKTWEFEPGRMRDVRVASAYIPLSAWSALLRRPRGWQPNGIWQGPLAFDYGAKTYRFGAGLDEAEARELLPHLLRRLSPNDPTPLADPSRLHAARIPNR